MSVELNHYIAAGEGNGLLLLPGATGKAEVLRNHVEYFSRRFRVVASSYPPVRTMSELVEMLCRLLDRERLSRSNIWGGSYGGLVAQAFAVRHPERVIKLVLSHTGPPEPARAVKLERAVRMLRLLPEVVVREVYRRRMASMLPKRLRARLNTNIWGMPKSDILAAIERIADFDTHYKVELAEALQSIPVLLVMSEDDVITPLEVRTRMRQLYPNAETFLFHGSGHETPISREAEYFAAVDRFL